MANNPANYPYTTTVPNAPDDPADDQPLMQINTGSLGLWSDVDHIGFNQDKGGVHNIIHLLPQPAGGISLLADSYGYIFSRAVSLPVTSPYFSSEQLFYRGGGGPAGTAGETQLTTGVIPVAPDDGYSYLPGGILVQWKTTAGTVASGTTIDYPIPFLNRNFVVVANQYGAANDAAQRAVSVVSSNTTQFLVRITTLGSSPTGSSCRVTFFAIGN